MMINIATALVFVLSQVLPTEDVGRLKSVTDDVIGVVDDDFDAGALKSNISRPQAVSMVTAVVAHESNFRMEVETCKIRGDGGKSIGLGQVMRGINWEGHSYKEICGNRKLQLKLALHVVDRCWSLTPRPDAALRCYTSGDAAKDSYAARHEYSLFLRFKKAIDTQTTSTAGSAQVMPVSDKSTSEVIAKNP